MKYVMYKLTFPNGIHIGNGRLSETDISIHSDTFFSAMCIEALSIGGEKKLKELYESAKDNRLFVSDAFPYINDIIYLPKPMCRIESKEQDMSLKKEFKKLEYIPVDKLDEYMSGNINPVECNQTFSALGAKGLYQKVSLKYDENNELYSVGVYRFSENSGLYVIFGVVDEDTEELIEEILSALQYAGIGGKRSAGYGRFEYEKCKVPFEDKLSNNSEKYMTLSSCMAADNELSKVLEGASYKLIKRSGFVQSQTYSENQLKKRDFYMFAPGAVFSKKFVGDVFDVSIEGGHPVYKYAKPILIGIGGAI